MLENKQISVSKKAYKSELLEIIKRYKEKVPFACIEIAKHYIHRIFYTLPYHCELQPIKGIWALVKNEVSVSGPHSNLLEIRNKLFYTFVEKRKTVNIAKDYEKSEDHMLLIDDELDNEIILVSDDESD
ncbi:4665_t:CDS:2 [Scutellospora calospora]|uniref:4665_t:CDS:1 n=1 Tax=Scutellospora calospora TaxID=85575 RepID=A0ACA9L7B8_9GLOM|nr:4665_t:CDS:2 [Scutellospora calospora]